jgi:hypothetical protein
VRGLIGEAAVRVVKTATCDTDLRDAQWEFLQPMLPKPNRRSEIEQHAPRLQTKSAFPTEEH